jgi:tRNA threonylcarbamoyladenosine biosynthesis protein TsaB
MNQTALLAIDTSTEFCSVALLRADDPRAGLDEVQLFTRHEATGAVSSTRILPAVLELLAEAQCGLQTCVAIAFGAGPGSFTGLRTAVGVAQGLAFGLGIPVVPVGTLLACAEAARTHDPSVQRVLAALDARMDEVYWAEYAWAEAAGEWLTVHPAALDAPAAVPAPAGRFTLAGNAAAVFGARLSAAGQAAAIDSAASPQAGAVARLGWRAWQAGRTLPAAQAAPLYVRDKVAFTSEERLAARQHGLPGPGGVASE